MLKTAGLLYYRGDLDTHKTAYPGAVKGLAGGRQASDSGAAGRVVGNQTQQSLYDSVGER